jgi:hypothetical protein
LGTDAFELFVTDFGFNAITHNDLSSLTIELRKKNRLTEKKIRVKRTRYTMKYNLEFRNDWPEVNLREWERLEKDVAFKEGFLLAMNNVSIKINTKRKNWDHMES